MIYSRGVVKTSHQPSATDRPSALAILRQNKLRVTGPRRAILDLLAREHGPFTVDEIHARLRKSTVDRVTVYRCIAALEKVGLVRRCDFGDDKWRYEAIPPDGHHHHHIICKTCRKVEILDICVAESLTKLVAAKGYTDVSHSLEFFGICRACRK